MNHVVSFSSGLSSAVTAEKVLERHPEAYIVFMDTLIEDEDNYRFLNQWLEVFEPSNFVRLHDGRTPQQVWEENKIIPNQKIAPCTFELKIKPFRRWLDSLSGPSTVYIGFDIDEMHRCEATTRAYTEAGYEICYPLIEWKPLPDKVYADICRDEWGIEPPVMYSQGYTHANCGGTCCKQGIADWLRTLKNRPEIFHDSAQWEKEARQRHGDYAFLRDQSDGKVTALPLEELRVRFNNGNVSKRVLSRLDFESPCVQCGVGAYQINMFGEEL